MTVKDFLQSGELELYCLGALPEAAARSVNNMCRLHPEILQERTAIERFLEQSAAVFALSPRSGLKEKTLQKLGFTVLNVNELPVIDARSDHREWLALLKDMLPEKPAEALWFYPLTQKSGLRQSLVYTRMSIPDETHDDLRESFFILEGHCQCMVGDTAHVLGPGDFLDIPLHIHHDIRLLTPYVVAILQQQDQG